MPMRKRVVARWGLACSLIAVIGVSAVPVLAGATALSAPEPASKPLSHTVVPVKRAEGHVYRPLLHARLCRDHRRLQMGVASWYGESALHRTASGEAFRPDELAAASRTLPFNTRIRITNLHNGRSVVVRINDRGPYVQGRIVDVTPKAAAELGMKMHGTAPVYIEIVRNETKAAAADPVEFGQR
jgi:peptidoglycan lytic transglycosylase